MRLGAVVLALVGAAGCAPAPAAPVIERVDLPATVTADPAGEYPVPLKIMFHDDDDVVTELRVALPTISMSFASPLQPPVLAGTLALTVRFPSRTAKGAQEIDLTLVDHGGLTSLPATESVTLQ